MTIVPFAVAGLLAVLLAFSLVRIAALPLPASRRVLLALLRIFLAGALAAAFFEPVLTFDSLSSPRQPIPVLIDASQSMRLFSPNESVLPVIKKLEAWNARHPDLGHRFAFYCFGDSLRRLPDNAPVAFSDRRSFLPEASKESAFRRVTAMLLISDGNWSNTTSPVQDFSDKNVWFIPLPAIRPSPFLRMEVAAVPSASPADSPLAPTLALDGYSAIAGGETLWVAAAENGVFIAKRSIGVRNGSFHLSVSLPLPPRKAGRHLYRFTAQVPGGDRQCSGYALHTALPRHFTWSATHAAPSLDERFLKLAFERDPDFLELAPESREAPDLAVLFDADKRFIKERLNLKTGGILLFIGSFPGAARVVAAGVSNTFLGPRDGESGKNLGADLDLTRFPPPSSYYVNPGQPPDPSAVVLSACLQARTDAPVDTVPVIFSGQWAGHRSLVCAASGIWRWDFAPLALTGAEEQAFAFSRGLVAWVKDMLTNGLSDRFLLYPAGPLSEIDSIPLRILFPADLAIPSEVRLSCRFTADRFRFDTSFTATAVGGSRQSARFKPLPAGNYRLEATGSSGNRRFSFADSLFIDQDRSEYAVSEQNTTLLRELAQPLSDISDTSVLASIFTTVQAGSGRVKEIFPIQRDWPLLMVILGLLAVEWVARRVMRLD
jgi:hypothetical protein